MSLWGNIWYFKNLESRLCGMMFIIVRFYVVHFLITTTIQEARSEHVCSKSLDGVHCGGESSQEVWVALSQQLHISTSPPRAVA